MYNIQWFGVKPSCHGTDNRQHDGDQDNACLSDMAAVGPHGNPTSNELPPFGGSFRTFLMDGYGWYLYGMDDYREL